MPDYNIKSIDLSSGPKTNQALELDQPIKTLTVLTRGGLAYVAPEAGAPGIPIRSVGQSISFDQPTKKLYFTFTKGSGIIEILVSGGGTCVGFSGGGGAAAVVDREIILAHIAPRTYTGAVLVNNIYQNDQDVLASGAGGGGTAGVAHDAGLQLHGLRLNAPLGGANAGARSNWDRFSPALLTMLNAGTLVKSFPRDFYFELDDLVYATKTYASANALFGAVGFGYHGISLGAIEGQSVSFYFDGSSTTWEAVVRDFATGILHRHALTGYALGVMHQLQLRIGAAAGSPYVRWLVDGVQAYELNLPLATPMVRHANQFTPLWAVGRADALDSVDLWALLGGGAVVRYVLPAAA